MKKIAAALVLALALGGCAQLQAISGGIRIATKSIVNPVTKADEAKVELAVDTAIKTLDAYKQACQNGTADKNCRINVAQIQAYTRQVKPLMARLRSFVDDNDQINASVVYNQLTALFTDVKKAAADLGVNIGGTI